MTIDERHEALRESVELLLLESREQSKQIAGLVAVTEGLVRIANLHHERLGRLEDQH
jgi:hypothetical protein